MKPKCVIILLLLTLLPLSLFAQHWRFEFQTGAGSYALKDLKELQEDFLYDIPARARIVNDFPPYLYTRFSGHYELQRIGMGLSYGHYSTGSRIHYSDYSGEVSVKQLIRSNLLGFPFTFVMTHEVKKTDFRLRLEPGINFTKLEIRQSMRILDASDESKYVFTSASINIYCGLSFNYHFKLLDLGTELGYAIDTGGSLYLDGDKNAKLINMAGDPIKSNLSGLRAAIVLAHMF